MRGRFRVQVEHDRLRKIARATPLQAVTELVWNGLDANANRVDVEVDGDDPGMRAIAVRDDGHGFTREEAEALFGKVGGSWKRHGARSKSKRRVLGGKQGQGRFRALALGRVADWTARYESGDAYR